VVAAHPETLGMFEQTLFGPFTAILQADVERERALSSHTKGARG
jgi:hypothetical protein